MSQVILQINVKINIPVAEIEKAWLEVAQPLADTPGLRWKVWLKNEAEAEVGGIYLFDDESSVQAFLEGEMVAAIKASPAIDSVVVKKFHVMEAHTAITRGPVGQGVRV